MESRRRRTADVTTDRADGPEEGRVADAATVAAALADQDAVGLIHLDAQGRIVTANPAAGRLTSRIPDALVGARMADMVHPHDLVIHAADIDRLRAQAVASLTLDLRLGREGAWQPVTCGLVAFPAAADQVGHVDADRQEIVLLLSRAIVGRVQVDHGDQALFDRLTRLISRPLLLDMLADHLRHHQPGLAVVAIDLDRFKAVNDSLGQATGDRVLVEIANRLRNLVRSVDVVARLGGDDFAVLYTDVSTRPRVNALVERMLDVIAEPIEVDGRAIQVSASAGVILVDPGEELSADAVISSATAALGAAKRSGRARWEVYDQQMDAASSNRLTLETSLRAAIEQRTLTVAYQPIRRLSNGRLDGAEALSRWVHPVLGTVGPEAFMPIAEETGLAEPLTSFVLEHAITSAAGWRGQSGADLHVAVNLSAQDLDRRGIANEIAGFLSAVGLPPRALRLEIVETLLVEAGQRLKGNLLDLRDLGVGLGIDDFGTGYSSMSYLKNLPIDFVKIDKSFVTGLGTSREDSAIVQAVIGLAKSLDLTVVAEGIENPTQMRLLRELGCDLGQGFLLGHAEPAEVLSANLLTDSLG